MKKLLILGGGTAGTIIANKLHEVLDQSKWHITIVDRSETHYYQPGFLFIPFGIYTSKDVMKPKRDFYPRGVEVVIAEIDKVEPDNNRVLLKNNQILSYDYLIVATGTHIHPEETEGLIDENWHKNKFDFYTLEGACALANFFKSWEGGKLVLNIVEMPIKCPVAPLEFLFLADSFFTQMGMRDKVDIHFVTPLPGAFTKPIASGILGDILEKKNIKLTTEFGIARVDNEKKVIVSWDEQEIPYDVLVTIPTNKGDSAIERSGMGNEFNYIATDKETLKSKNYPNIFVIGDTTDLTSSKAGSVAHFEAEILYDNFLNAVEGRPMRAKFDGHANCFIESGYGKGLLIDFNFDVEPLPGKYPLPGIGPFSLLQETKMNHYGKVMFRWMYWNLLLRGQELPVTSNMSMAGKRY
ncbi:MAG: NAD(P)/FAD-dependent oxidoreductase [Ignavibacteriae bacterium]|nr:NAD(P)/FAD-dependent oxidoreductase [Ignavibacteriota bacterium]